jgi:hypothetical protein
VAQSLGTPIPASDAARMIEVPSGTETEKPSTVKFIVFVLFFLGVPKSLVSSIIFSK